MLGTCCPARLHRDFSVFFRRPAAWPPVPSPLLGNSWRRGSPWLSMLVPSSPSSLLLLSVTIVAVIVVVFRSCRRSKMPCPVSSPGSGMPEYFSPAQPCLSRTRPHSAPALPRRGSFVARQILARLMSCQLGLGSRWFWACMESGRDGGS